MIIADANAWIDFIKEPNAGSGAVLRGLLREDRVALVGIVLAEVLRGLRRKDGDRIESLLFGIPYLEMTRRVWARAGRIAMDLDASGLPIPMTDVFIAAAALEGGHELFTRDRHFDRIPSLQLYSPEEVV